LVSSSTGSALVSSLFQIVYLQSTGVLLLPVIEAMVSLS